MLGLLAAVEEEALRCNNQDHRVRGQKGLDLSPEPEPFSENAVCEPGHRASLPQGHGCPPPEVKV